MPTIWIRSKDRSWCVAPTKVRSSPRWDGKDHDLSVEDLLITDSPNGERGSRVLGIAGVMGGMYGEVTAETKNILLESAHFDQVSIARSARRHKIPSEASRRFERGVDDQLQPAAAQMAAELMVRYGNGRAERAPDRLQYRL